MWCNVIGDEALFQAAGRRIIVRWAFSVAVPVGGMLVWWGIQQGRIDALAHDLASVEAEVRNAGGVVGDLEASSKLGEALQAQLDSLASHPVEREILFHTLLSLSQRLPSAAWLREVRLAEGKILVEGFIDDHDKFSTFLDDLQGAQHIEAVRVLSLRSAAQMGRRVDEFAISIQVGVADGGGRESRG